MRRRTKININPKHVFIALVIFCIALIGLSFRFGDRLSPVKDAVGMVITPMQVGINSVGTYVSDKLDTFKSIRDLQAENERLKEQVNILSYENKLLLQDKYELDGLRELYELDQKYLDYPKVAARVIGKDTNNWYNVFNIDKGSRDGIQKNMNVLAGNGLAGIVTDVYYNYSVVRSIIDDNSNVTGMLLKTADTFNVQGDLRLMDSGKIRVKDIGRDAQIQDGDEVVTAHISLNFLPGILIGYVSDIQLDANNMTRTAYLTPVVDFEHLEEVLIITELMEPLLEKDPAAEEEEQN
ncbi:rod shape-determining protein MreC [Anaerotaenia torta]|uniref:rod shape-determining protein MreC n=1 Tax=Anaerotaenia torta TaxID=433293 RepID=UPI003D24C627